MLGLELLGLFEKRVFGELERGFFGWLLWDCGGGVGISCGIVWVLFLGKVFMLEFVCD